MNIVNVNKKIIDKILKCKKPADCLSLYIFIHSEIKNKGLKDTKTIKSNILENTEINQNRYKNAMEDLIKMGFIENIIPRNEKGKITGSFFKLKQI